MIIVGAGMAGLLAANMLAKYKPTVLERQTSLPNNHSAVLRFRSSVVGDVLNIPFKKVNMIKATVPWRNPVADALSYSYKNTGQYRSDRSILSGITTAERWIAPTDLIERMAVDVNIQYGRVFSLPSNDVVISTIPMPEMMRELGHDTLDFDFYSGVNLKAEIPQCDAYASVLVPDPNKIYSRISLTGSELVVECPGCVIIDDEDQKEIIAEAMMLMGIEGVLPPINAADQRYAKINPVDDTKRKQFIFWATDKFNIFSLGRYATWRPGLLLDDLVQDIRLIERWVKDRYNMSQHRSR